jgi:hypothetical protein
MRCLGASGQLGYGMPKESFWAGVADGPDAIGADMGSTDPGPYYLGSGELATGGVSRREDLQLLLRGRDRTAVQAVIGSAGTAGAAPHLRTTVDDLRVAAKQAEVSLTVAEIAADVPRDVVHRKLETGDIRPCGPVETLTHSAIDQAVHLVAQMGVEPVIEALATGVDLVVAGRSCDTAVFAAAALREGFDRGIAGHQAKLLECASQCADPGGRDAIMGELAEDSFRVRSMHPDRRCTPLSVAAHSLYEQMDPNVVDEPGGHLDLSACVYVAEGERATRVHGARWIPSSEYWVKLEGAALAGYRAFSLGGIRDPIAIRELDPMLDGVRGAVQRALPTSVTASDYTLRFLVYGRDAVLGHAESERVAEPREVLVLTDVVAGSADLAHSICGIAKQYLLHYFYDGILATGGNLAIPFGPDVHDGGPVYTFNVYHLMRIDDPLELFPIRRVSLVNG